MARDARSDYGPSALDCSAIGVYDFIPRVSPKLSPPYHLDPFVKALDGVIGGSIVDGRFVVACPIRHAKTVTILHAIALILAKDPTKEIMYISYGANFAQRNSRKARRFFLEAGGVISKDHNTIQEWVTEAGGQVLATGIDGEITGRGADIIFIDDPIKSREQSMSQIVRDVAGEFVDEAIGRLNVGGSVFLVAARFHEDDPSGRCLKKVDEDGKPEWQHIHLRAIEDEGLPTERALWPERRPLDHLKKRRKQAGPYLWAANYQGDPKPPGGNIFGTPGRYMTLPEGMRVILGVDLAYSGGKKNDHGCIVALGEHGGLFYVLHVERFLLRIDHARHRMRFAMGRFPGAASYSYVSGTERGPIILLGQETRPGARDGIVIHPLPARYNKAVRAAKTAAAWNGDPEKGEPPRVLVPFSAPWLAEFLGEVCSFTGTDADPYDDQVDGLVAAFDMLEAAGSSFGPGLAGRTQRGRGTSRR